MFRRRFNCCSENEKETLNECSGHFIIAFFNITYFLGLSPFRLTRKCSADGVHFYVATSCLLHTTICALLLFLGLFWILRDLRVSLPSSSKNQNPAVYLVSIQRWISSAEKFVLMSVFWFHKSNVVNIVNYLVRPENSFSASDELKSTKRSIRKGKIISTILQLTYTTCAFVEIINMKYTGATLIDEDKDRPSTFSHLILRWWSVVVEAGHFNMFSELDPSNSTSVEISSVSHILGGVAIIGLYYR